jgi:molecular chaperone GrpE
LTDDKQPKNYGFGDSDDLAALMDELESIDLDAEVRKLEGKKPSTDASPTVEKAAAGLLDLNDPLAFDLELSESLGSMGLKPPTSPKRTIASMGLKPPTRSAPTGLRNPTTPATPLNPAEVNPQAEVAALREKTQRQAAKFDNYRKRLTREKTEAVQFANERLIKDILPSLDNLTLALEHQDTTDKEQLAMGVKMTLNMLMTALGHHGLIGFDSLNKPFDPRQHQALNQIDDPSVAANTIVKVAQRGYKLHDRLLRPALVTVAIGGVSNSEGLRTEPVGDTPQTIPSESETIESIQTDSMTQTSEPVPAAQTECLDDLDLDIPVETTANPVAAEESGKSASDDDEEEYDLDDLQDALDMFLAGEDVE